MNKYLEKIASKIPEKDKDDFVNTAVLGGLGGAETMAIPHLWNHNLASGLSRKAKFGLGTALTLGVDYAGVRLGNAINRTRHGETVTKEL